MASKMRNGSSGASTGGGARLVPGLAVHAGQLIAGKYRVEELLDSGASGVVVVSRQVQSREPVTLTLLTSYTDEQAELVQRRVEKARGASLLRGEHIARIVDVGTTEEGIPYVASERPTGGTLDDELDARGRLPWPEAARWILQACEGLAEAHVQGVMHGDLSPKNIFLAETETGRARGRRPSGADDSRVVKILDFGMASPVEVMGGESTSALYGSPAYVSPEQIRDPKNVDHRADVWALGAILYELISGTPPFASDTVSGVMVSVVFDAPPLLTDAPYELARVINQCLAKEPSGRPADVGALAEALAPFAGGDGGRIAERVKRRLATAPNERSAMRKRPAADRGSLHPVAATIAPMPMRRGWKAGKAAPWGETTQPSLRTVLKEKFDQKRRVAGAAMAGLLGMAFVAVRAGSASPAAPLALADDDVLPPATMDVPAFVPSIAADTTESVDVAALPSASGSGASSSVKPAATPSRTASRSATDGATAKRAPLVRTPPWPSGPTGPTLPSPQMLPSAPPKNSGALIGMPNTVGGAGGTSNAKTTAATNKPAPPPRTTTLPPPLNRRDPWSDRK